MHLTSCTLSLDAYESDIHCTPIFVAARVHSDHLWLFWRSTTHLMPFRRGLVLFLRVLMIALVVLSLSGLSVENTTEQVNVMFALDASDSVGEEDAKRR